MWRALHPGLQLNVDAESECDSYQVFLRQDSVSAETSLNQSVTPKHTHTLTHAEGGNPLCGLLVSYQGCSEITSTEVKFNCSVTGSPTTHTPKDEADLGQLRR